MFVQFCSDSPFQSRVAREDGIPGLLLIGVPLHPYLATAPLVIFIVLMLAIGAVALVCLHQVIGTRKVNPVLERVYFALFRVAAHLLSAALPNPL